MQRPCASRFLLLARPILLFIQDTHLDPQTFYMPHQQPARAHCLSLHTSRTSRLSKNIRADLSVFGVCAGSRCVRLNREDACISADHGSGLHPFVRIVTTSAATLTLLAAGADESVANDAAPEITFPAPKFMPFPTALQQDNKSGAPFLANHMPFQPSRLLLARLLCADRN